MATFRFGDDFTIDRDNGVLRFTHEDSGATLEFSEDGVAVGDDQTVANWNDFGDVAERTGMVEDGALRLGFDPAVSPFDDAIGMWRLNDHSGDVTDSIGNNDLTVEGPASLYRQAALHDDYVMRFIEDDDNTVYGTVPEIDAENDDLTLMAAVKFTDEDSSHRMVFSWGDPNESEYIGISSWSGDGWKIMSNGNTPGDGTAIDWDRWYIATLRFDINTYFGELFVDGEFNYDVDASGNDWLDNADTVEIANRAIVQPGSENGMDGWIGPCIIWNRALSDSEIETASDQLTEAMATTNTETTDSGPDEVTIEADIPDDTSVTVTIYRDESDHEEIQVPASGVYSLNFTDGGSYDAVVEIETTDPEVSPNVRFVRLGDVQGALSGGIVGQEDGASQIRDIWVTAEGAPDPRTGNGQIWLEYESE